MKRFTYDGKTYAVVFRAEPVSRLTEGGFEQSHTVVAALVELPNMNVIASGMAMKDPKDQVNNDEAMKVAFDRMVGRISVWSLKYDLVGAFANAQRRMKVSSIRLGVYNPKPVLTPEQEQRVKDIDAELARCHRKDNCPVCDDLRDSKARLLRG